jgi:hypothetical protein
MTNRHRRLKIQLLDGPLQGKLCYSHSVPSGSDTFVLRQASATDPSMVELHEYKLTSPKEARYVRPLGLVPLEGVPTGRW